MRSLRMIPGLLFGLAFAGGGLFILSQTALPTWNDWYAMQKWQPTHAQLLSVSGSENETEARYRYQLNGVSHENDRVYVAAFNDNIGSYHGHLLTRLRNFERTGEPVPVWVNPLNPGQAVIDRDMRWGLFAFMSGFCAIFIAIGLVVVYASATSKDTGTRFKRPSLRVLREEWKTQQQDPNFKVSFPAFVRERVEELKQAARGETKTTDWKARKGWETPKISSEAKKGAIMMWVFAIAWNAISSPLLFVLPEEIEKENYPALIGLLFPLVGAFLLYKAITSTLEFRRFGKVLFEMDPFPGAIGGHVGGWVQVARLNYNTATASSAELSVRLECVYSYMSGSGDNRSRRESIKWAEEGTPQLESSGKGVKLGLRFDVPDSMPEADSDQTGAYHFWRLSVKAQMEGVDLSRQYNIPVFRTGKMSRFVRHDVSAQVLKRRVQESGDAKQAIESGKFDLPGLSRAMRLSDEGGEIRMAFPMFRNKFLTAIAGVFAGGFGFASYSIVGSALKGGLFGLMTGLFGLPFFLVAIVAAIATIYLLFNNLRVHIRRNEITVLRRLLFVPVYRRQLAVTDISHLTIKRSGSTGQGVNRIEHFKLLAHDKNGKSVTLAEDLDGEDVSAHFRDYLAGRMNVESRS